MTTLSGVIEELILSLLGSTPDQAGIAAGQTTIRAYRDDPNMGVAWRGLAKADWCARIELLLGDPAKINQRSTEYCGPAACLYILFKRTPAAMASFCVELARVGHGSIGELNITMTQEIRDYGVVDYAKNTKKVQPIDPVDYILMLAMQNQMSIFNIDSPDDNSAKPELSAGGITDILKDTNLFTVTSKDHATIDDFQNLDSKTETVLIGDISFFSKKPFTIIGGGRHAVVLVPPVTVKSGIVEFHFWSWGMYQGTETLDIEGDTYVQRVTENKFNVNVDTAVFATVKS
jgi:hypothetical protein